VQIDLKNDDFMISVTKNASDVLATVEEDELRKDGKKLWKTMKNTSINLYCIEVQKLPIFCNFLITIKRNWYNIN